MGMTRSKEFVNSCRKIGALLDFLCQAMDQVDEKDKEIAELKAKAAHLEDDVAFWKKKLDEEMASRSAEVGDMLFQERRLKRALYKACANWAKSEIRRRFGGYPHEGNAWFKMKTKCRAMAERYK